MSRTEYETQKYSLTAAEAAEHQELLEGVDVTDMASIETATAHRVAREIKKCAHDEVQEYLASEDFKQMVENLKRRERERLLQDVTLQIAKERDAMLAQERDKLKKELAEQKSFEEILAENQKKIEDQHRKDLEDRQQADAARLQEVHRRHQQEQEQEMQRAKELEGKRQSDSEAQQLILHRNKKLSFGLKKKSFY